MMILPPFPCFLLTLIFFSKTQTFYRKQSHRKIYIVVNWNFKLIKIFFYIWNFGIITSCMMSTKSTTKIVYKQKSSDFMNFCVVIRTSKKKTITRTNCVCINLSVDLRLWCCCVKHQNSFLANNFFFSFEVCQVWVETWWIFRFLSFVFAFQFKLIFTNSIVKI